MMVVLAGAALAFGACGNDDDNDSSSSDTKTTEQTTNTETTSDQAPRELTVPLTAQSKSGVTGTVTFTEDGDQTQVEVQLEGDTSTDAHPAHIHPGTCAKLDPAPKYPLDNVEDGSSTTTIDASIDDLLATPMAVNVHRSDAAIQTYIACGDIVDSMTVDLAAQNDSGITGSATLTAAGDQTRVVVTLTGDTPKASHPSHLHDGTCDDLDPAPQYPLANVVNGTSTTTIKATLDDLRSEPYALNVHKSNDDLETYVACGDLESSGDASTSDETASTDTSSDSSGSGSGSGY
jgi:Cu/Zn superoxide dismutase